jgi:hypothetical protein
MEGGLLLLRKSQASVVLCFRTETETCKQAVVISLYHGELSLGNEM